MLRTYTLCQNLMVIRQQDRRSLDFMDQIRSDMHMIPRAGLIRSIRPLKCAIPRKTPPHRPFNSIVGGVCQTPRCKIHGGLLATVSLPRLLQGIGVQTPEVVHYEQPVLSYQFVVEPDLPAAPLGRLDTDYIPVNGAFISVVRLLVGPARRQVE